MLSRSGRRGAWTWPRPAPCSSRSVRPATRTRAGQHRGIDVGGAEGERCSRRARDRDVRRLRCPATGSRVTIATADGYSVTLVHLGSIAVARRARRRRGRGVGTSGPSGDAGARAPVRPPRRPRDTRRRGLPRPARLPAASAASAAPPPPPAPSPAPAPAPLRSTRPLRRSCPGPSRSHRPRPRAGAVAAGRRRPAGGADAPPRRAAGRRADSRRRAVGDRHRRRPAGARRAPAAVRRVGSAIVTHSRAASSAPAPARHRDVLGDASSSIQPRPRAGPRRAARRARPLRRRAHRAGVGRIRCRAPFAGRPPAPSAPRRVVRDRRRRLDASGSRLRASGSGAIAAGRARGTALASLADRCSSRRAAARPGRTAVRDPAPIMDADALLPDDTDLLRELDTRTSGTRTRRSRPTSSSGITASAATRRSSSRESTSTRQGRPRRRRSRG